MIGTLAIAFLGVRGMGSIYYLAYGQNHADFAQLDQLWAVTRLAILVSIVVHGIVSGPFILFAERRKSHIHSGQEETMLSHTPSGRPIVVEGTNDSE